MSAKIAQSIVDEVQAHADAHQAEAFRFEVRGDTVYEITAWPRPRSKGKKLPVPTDDREGTYHKDDDTVYECRAFAVDLASGDTYEKLYDEAEKLRETLVHPGTEPSAELIEFANASRKHSLRRYAASHPLVKQDAFVPVELRWVVVDDPGLGRKPQVRERDDLDVE